ncbi:hypothetical protein F8388_020308 [Cannabis sativa]|uniref:MSP domain-containing protein n=1 Tax=Cannabis sativa TaxID=3483 RepID=A0A7J6FVX1_CANSA|nr:hypothetical protein F8388_020308 [Cannabis sativa]
MTAPSSNANSLISVLPDELKFQFELEKQTFCDLKVVNNTEHHVAFKYFVRPNTGVILPWDSCVIRVTLQAQRDYPPDMQCKDKFLLQSTIVSPNTDVDDLPQDTGGRALEECKLRVVYVTAQGNLDDETTRSSMRSPDSTSNQTIQQLKEERDLAIRQTLQLQVELDLARRRKNRKGDPGFSFRFAVIVGFIGIMVGFLFNLLSSSPTTQN